MAFKKDSKVKSNFTKITIGLASPEDILESSFGEVTKPETINYRTYKPVRLPNLKPSTTVPISRSVTVCSASASSVLQRTMSVPAVSTSVSVIKVSSVIDVVSR